MSNGDIGNPDSLGGIPSSIELPGAAVDRSAAAINEELFSGLDTETLETDSKESGAAGVSVGSEPGKGFESVREEWWYIAGAGLRTAKGLFFHRKKISKEQYGETAGLWADYLAKKYPEGVDDSELLMALLATGAMFAGADERPETEEDKKGGLMAYLKRIGAALIGR